jgi:hypothetical protein
VAVAGAEDALFEGATELAALAADEVELEAVAGAGAALEVAGAAATATAG